ncbi:MAG TPA: hypothetical protein VG389_28535 [Myxococcota bacterium]|nr:hypothetical protein [Myxococcota bacterium]
MRRLPLAAAPAGPLPAALALAAAALLQAACDCGPPADGDAGADAAATTDAGPERLDAVLTVTPADGNQFGDYLVTVTADQPLFAGLDVEDITVRVGDNRLIFMSVLSDTTIEGSSQGHPSPADDNSADFTVDVRVDVPGFYALAADAFTFHPPLDPLFNDFWAVGASFTAGFQSNSLNAPAQLMGPAAQIARAVGAYFPQPLAVGEGVPPAFTLADVNPLTGEVEINKVEAFQKLFPLLAATGGTFEKLRADPYIFPHNLAVPGGVVRHILNGTNGDPFHPLDIFIQAPFEHFLSSIMLPSPVENLEIYHPTVVIGGIDFYGNDILGGDDTPVPSIHDDLVDLFRRMAELPGSPPFFVLTLVDVNSVPENSFEQDERYETLRANNALVDAAALVNGERAAAGYPPRIFIGDFFSPAFRLIEEPLGNAISFGGETLVVWGCDTPDDPAGTCTTTMQTVNGENNGLVVLADGTRMVYGLDRAEGIISLDGLHFTNTGYGILSNETIALVNASVGPAAPDPANRLLGADVAPLDLESVVASDPLSPLNMAATADALRASGVIDLPPFTDWADPSPLPTLGVWDRCAMNIGVYAIPATDWAAAGCPLDTGVVVAATDTTVTAADATAMTPGETVTVTVTVTDTAGMPITGFPVVFWVDSDGDLEGFVGDERGIDTDAAGQASTTYTAGSSTGPVRVNAQVAGVWTGIDLTRVAP